MVPDMGLLLLGGATPRWPFLWFSAVIVGIVIWTTSLIHPLGPVPSTGYMALLAAVVNSGWSIDTH